MQKISFIISNFNTYKYSKFVYESLRKNLNQDHEIILLSDNSLDETDEWILAVEKTDKKVKSFLNTSGESKGIPFMYNKGVEIASNEIICILHSDMYIPSQFDEIMLLEMGKYDFVTSFRVEPPIYPPSRDKLILDFGLNLEDFNENSFNNWHKKILKENKGKGQLTMFFPWITTKTLFNKIGGIDLLFHKYMVEDVDFYLRIKLSGAKYWQTFNTAVYHFCSRSSKFKNDKIGEGDSDWHQQHLKSTRNFLRKWGNIPEKAFDKNFDLLIPKRFYIGFIVKNCTYNILAETEPFCSNIFIENENIKFAYIADEQKNTYINLNEKIKTDLSFISNDIIVKFDANKFDLKAYNILLSLGDLILNLGNTGSFVHYIFEIRINNIKTYEKELIIYDNLKYI